MTGYVDRDLTKWELVERWPAENPVRCTVCGEVYEGREAIYMPAMCERDGCPGPGPQVSVEVEAVENVEIRPQGREQ